MNKLDVNITDEAKGPLLIIGLGNPGKKYQNTRHNVGFMVVDRLAERCEISWKTGRLKVKMAHTNIDNHNVILVKPQSFMNLCGSVIVHLKQFYRVPVNTMLIIYDDFNLPFGTLRYRPKGSDGGHNGLKSLIKELGSQTFPRLRVGTGNHFKNAVDFVLAPFNQSEKAEIDFILSQAVESVIYWINNGITNTMNKYNKDLPELQQEKKTQGE